MIYHQFNEKELSVILSLINMYQFDGCEYTIDKINLKELKEKIKCCVRNAKNQ